MIHIEESRCVRCGLCARICPLRCFRVTDEGVSVHHEDRCMRCGQCVAACPRAAVSLDGVNPDSLLPLSPLPDAERLAALIRQRRSVRAFRDEPVPEETLRRALDVVRYAPTGKNLENVSWLVIEGKAALRRVADRVVDAFRPEPRLAGVTASHDRGGDPIFRGAPCAVFACASGAYDLDVVNCSIAVATLDLLLPTLGLGGCWAGYAMRAASMSPAVREAMGAEQGMTPLAGLMVGAPAVEFRRVPSRREARVRWVKETLA